MTQPSAHQLHLRLGAPRRHRLQIYLSIDHPLSSSLDLAGLPLTLSSSAIHVPSQGIRPRRRTIYKALRLVAD